MAKITRYTGNFKAFAADATGDNRTIFGDDTQADDLDSNLNPDFFSGWEILPIGAKPPREWFNGVQFSMTQVLAYLHQVGVPEWDAAQEFHTGSLTNKGSALWVSQVDNNIGNDPELDGGTNWLPAGIADPNANGLVARTAPFTSSARTIVAGDGLDGTDLDGVGGNPSLNVDSTVTRNVSGGDGINVTGTNANKTVAVDSTVVRNNADQTISGDLTADRLRLTATNNASAGSTLHAFQVGPTSGLNLIIDNNEILSRDNGVAGPLNLGRDGGIIIGGGGTISQVLFGSAAIDFGSVPAGDSSTQTITVTGATVGDVVAAGFDGYTGPSIHVDSAQVSAADTVMVKLFNNSGATLAAGTSTLKIFVFKN